MTRPGTAGDATGGPRRRARRLGAAVVMAFLLAGPAPTLAADPALPDLGPVTILLGDLPAGFASTNPDTASSFVDLAHSIAGRLDASPDAQDRNAVVFERRAGTAVEIVFSMIIAPISSADQVAFDASVANGGEVAAQAAGQTSGDEVTLIEGMHTGESRLAVRMRSASQGLTMEIVGARRGPVIEIAGHAWTDAAVPATSLAGVASTLDGRLAAVVGFAAPVFRVTGPLVPELTTHIPTPLDVSTDPAVVGTNLALSALALLLLAVSSKLATGMLAEHEAAIARRVPLVGIIGRAEARLGAALGGRVRGRRTGDALRLAGVTLFYGLVFSLLEPSWNPLTITGAWLFVSLTLAYAVVGLADDLVQWRAARAWDLPAELAVRPTNAALAVVSTVVSRAAAVVPGLMFGTPEALRLDDSTLDPARARRLTTMGFVALVAIGGGSWIATVATTGVARSGPVPPIVGGLEALLLVVFAVAVQNLFVSLIGLPGTAGSLVRRWNPVAWGAALVAVTFVFWHTLLNPTGDPSTVLSNRNVQVALGLAGVFTAVVLGPWVVLQLATRPAREDAKRLAAPAEAAAPASAIAPAVVAAPPVIVPAAPVASTALPAVLAPPGVFVPPGVLAPPISPAPSVAAAVMPTGALEASIATADGRARGRATFRVSGGWVTARTELIDPLASRQYRAFALLALAAWLVPLLVYAGSLGKGARPSDLAIGGFLVVFLAWFVAVLLGRAWLEQHRVTHTVPFPARAVVAAEAGRDWNLGCGITILFSPLVGLLYLLFARGRVLRIVAPLAADRLGPVSLRLKGSDAEVRYLRQLLLDARAAG